VVAGLAGVLAKSRVLRRLKEQFDELIQEPPPPGRPFFRVTPRPFLL
jgi:hypothetical protein